MKYFILATVDAEQIDTTRRVPAHDVIMNRLHQGKWPIYSGTSFKDKLSVGDKCLIYVGGYRDKCRHIVASATIDKFENDNTLIDGDDILTKVPLKILTFKDIEFYLKPVNIKLFIDELSFISNKQYWGTSLQGGCKIMSETDFNLIDCQNDK
ncbi:MAG: hypothetical protein ACPG52_07910 [Cognaticolwellia sp.]